MTFEELSVGKVVYLFQEPQKIISIRKAGKLVMVVTRNKDGKDTERAYMPHTEIDDPWSFVAPSSEVGNRRGGLLTKHLKKDDVDAIKNKPA
jgi:hypothetical protein